MEGKQIWLTVLIAFAVGVLASLLTVWASGEALLGPDGTTLNTTKEINANRCQADGTCEVNNLQVIGLGKIYSDRPLTISSGSGLAKLESDLALTKIGQVGGTRFLTNNEGSLTIIPQSGSAKLLAALTLSGDNYQGGVILKSNEMGSLTITPSSGAAKIEGYLSVTNLSGSGNAYACVDSGGKIFRSQTPCS